MNARIYPFTADCIQPAPVRIPANLKAAPDLREMLAQYERRMRKAALEPSSDRAEAFDEVEGDMGEAIFDEVERLQCAEFDRDNLLSATTGVLLLLTNLWLEDKLSEEEKEVVAAFREAVKECGK